MQAICSSHLISEIGDCGSFLCMIAKKFYAVQCCSFYQKAVFELYLSVVLFPCGLH